MKSKAWDNKNEIIEMRKKGFFYREIAERYNVSISPIYSILKKETTLTNKKPKTHNINYFDNIDTDTKAYFLGFIAADGCLTKRKSNAKSFDLTITLHAKDRIILDTLKKELNSENKILNLKGIARWDNTKERDHVRFSVTNKNISDSLIKLGIEPRKSLTMPDIIKNIPKKYRSAFILGYFDGDGSFSFGIVNDSRGYKSLKQHINFRGTIEFLQGIINELDNIKTYNLKHYHPSIASLSISAKENVKEFFKIYKDKPFYLKRKYNKFIEFFKTINYDPFN